MKAKFIHSLQSYLPGFFTESMPTVVAQELHEPAQLIEHKSKANARTIAAHAKTAEPVVITAIEQKGGYAVCDMKGHVLVAHVTFEHGKTLAREAAIKNQICTKLVKMATS